MAKKNTLAKGVGDTPAPKIIRNYDPMSMEKRIHDLEVKGGGSTGVTYTSLYNTPISTTGEVTFEYGEYDEYIFIMAYPSYVDTELIDVPVSKYTWNKAKNDPTNYICASNMATRSMNFSVTATGINVLSINDTVCKEIIGVKY